MCSINSYNSDIQMFIVPSDKDEVTRPLPLRFEFRLAELKPGLDFLLLPLAVSFAWGPEPEDQLSR